MLSPVIAIDGLCRLVPSGSRRKEMFAGAGEEGGGSMGIGSGGGRVPYFSCRRASVASSRLRVASASSIRKMSITFEARNRRLTATSTSEK